MKRASSCLVAAAAALCLATAWGFAAPSSASVARPVSAASAASAARRRLPITFLLGGDDENKPKLTRETEPDEYFASDFESLSTGDKLKDPLVLIGLASIFFPFVLLVIFNSMGLIGI